MHVLVRGAFILPLRQLVLLPNSSILRLVCEQEPARPTLRGGPMLTKILVVYSAVVTTVLGGFTLAGTAAARAQDKVQQFDEIDVHRINVRELDGTIRMVISNHARLPGVVANGKHNAPVDRPYAGMLFYNDEGNENGGLVFGGHRKRTATSWMPAWPCRSIATGRVRSLCNSRECRTRKPHRWTDAVRDGADRQPAAPLPRPRQGRCGQRVADGPEREKADRAAGHTRRNAEHAVSGRGRKGRQSARTHPR